MSDSALRPPASFPERIGRYDLLLPIASGGMATVYLSTARGPMGFEATLALKLTHPHLRETPEFAADLLEEAKLAARIRHRNVAAVIDADVDPLGVYLVMEYVEGDTLLGLMRTSPPLPKPMGLRVLLDALTGLHAAHEQCDDRGQSLGVVHRDFTPHNILVGTDGVARLTDFGIAKAASRLDHTRTGLVKGKTAYMAPEQAQGGLVDRRCDIWAAGVVAWELLAGRRLYSRDNTPTLLKVANEAPPRLRTLVESIHPDVDDAVASALQIDVQVRCPNALAFGKLLGAACRAHVGVAESEEVAAWVSGMLGPKLAARREALLRVRRLRARTTAGSEPATPSSAVAARGSREEVQPAAVDQAPAQELEAPVSARGPDEPTRTDGSAALTRSYRKTPSYRNHPALRPGLVVFGAGIAALGVFALLGGHRMASSPAPSAAAIAPAVAASASATPTARPTATDPAAATAASEPEAQTSASTGAPAPDLPGSASPPAPRPSRPSRGRPLSPSPPSPPPAQGGLAPLAPSPY